MQKLLIKTAGLSALSLASFIFFSTPSLATDYGKLEEDNPQNRTPLLVKAKYPGFTLQAFANQETCSLYPRRVVIERSYGAGTVETREVIKNKVSQSIYTAIEQAALEELIEEPNFLCDAPSSTTHAYIKNEKIILQSTGGCGSSKQERQGNMSIILRNIIDQYCP